MFFIERFFWIVDKERKEVPFKLNPIQRKYLLNRSNFDLILKARKEGLSSLILALWLHACLFFKNTRAVVISHEAEATARLFDRVKFYIDTMGTSDLKFDIELADNSQRHLSFPSTNSSFWIGTAGSKAFGRGDDITHLHLSEVAHYQDQSMMTGVLEACVNSAYRVMETTANGRGEAFFKLWEESKKHGDKAKWKRHFFSWYDDPTLTIKNSPIIQLKPEHEKIKTSYNLSNDQMAWYASKESEMIDKSLMPQEYPSSDVEAFLTTGNCIFSKEGLAFQDSRAEDPEWVGYLRDSGYSPEFVQDDFGPLSIYRQPEEGRKYFIFGDVAKGGLKGDRSIGGVWDRNTKCLVAIWAGRVDPVEFGKVLYGLGLFYNKAKIAVEVWPGPGIATGAKLVEMKYPNLYKHLKWDGEKRIDTTDVGWTTDERSRHEMLGTLMDAIDKKWSIFRSRDVINECREFIRKDNGRPEARAGAHDDCVIMAAGALHCMKFDPVSEMLDEHNNEDSPIIVSRLVGKQSDGLRRGPAWRKAHGSIR